MSKLHGSSYTFADKSAERNLPAPGITGAFPEQRDSCLLFEVEFATEGASPAGMP